MRLRRIVAAMAMITVLGVVPAEAQNSLSPAESAGIFSMLPQDSTTEHVLKTPSGDLPYDATAGTLSLHGQDGKVTARVFYTAYVAKRRAADRPVTFAFNGGPGAASAYLNLGLVGPRIVDFGPDANDGTTPKLRDNPESWLQFTDLVLIDPVGTGWSRSSGNDAGFWGVKQDAEALAKLITLYVQRQDRLASPKYLLGESYGGFRAAKVATALKDNQGILVSGIVMLSPLIEAQLIFGGSDDPIGAALQFPSIVAAELERRNAFDPKAVAAAERFAMTDYLVALAGPAPSGAAAKAFYDRVATLTGISREAVVRSRGLVSDLYSREVSSRPGKIMSPYDASYEAPDPHPESPYSRNDDPILDGFTRAFGAAFSEYARDELRFPCELTYNLLNTEVNRRWDWDGGRDDASVTDEIRELLSTVPAFRLMVLHGYSDVLTPYGASRYVLDHLPPTLAGARVALKVYPGGHMFYTRTDSRKAVAEDARRFFAGSATTE